MANKGTERYGVHLQEYKNNKKWIWKTQDTCAICGKPVDKSLKFPDPMSGTIDHIIPVDKGGHLSDRSNLQLAHFRCNRNKSNKLPSASQTRKETEIGNRALPLKVNWFGLYGR